MSGTPSIMSRRPSEIPPIARLPDHTTATVPVASVTDTTNDG